MEKEINENQLIIFEDSDKKIDVQLIKETLWLDAHQIAYLFDVQRPAIVKHIKNIYQSKELDENSTCSKMEQVAADGKKRKMNLYNLDVIIAVGYRVNSKKAIKFRIWATDTLKNYLIKQKEASEIFGMERDRGLFESALNTIYQSFNNVEFYPSFEEKAANLLYLVIKNHPFVDGNKRIGALLFLKFLYENLSKDELFYKFNSNTLTALCYLVAASPANQKEQLIKLIMNFISFE
jgi:phage regulator Rha-like protein